MLLATELIPLSGGTVYYMTVLLYDRYTLRDLSSRGRTDNRLLYDRYALGDTLARQRIANRFITDYFTLHELLTLTKISGTGVHIISVKDGLVVVCF